MDLLFGSPHYQHSSSLNFFTDWQKAKIKDHLIDSNNKSFGIFPSFSPLYLELSSGCRLIDTFSDHFSFNFYNKEKNEKICLQQLNSMVIESSLLHSAAIVTTDTSIKNDIAMSILHMHILNHPLIKTCHHAVFVTSSEAELFTIRCGINQASSKECISKIIVITDSIHVAKKIFDPSSHPLQIHAVAILEELCLFFSRGPNNLIEFWECPSCLNWHLHKAVNFNSKVSYPIPVYLDKMSWDYTKKSECDNILNHWKMTFQVSDGKGKHLFGHSNSLCVHVTRAITNHAPIWEYRLRFFPREEFKCPCGLYPIETWRHILFDCRRFNGYWNPRRDSLSHFVMFWRLIWMHLLL